MKDKIVYHGSYTQVSKIDLRCCENGKDFGQAFYLTTDRNEAINFSKNVARRYGLSYGCLNLYKFTNFNDLKVHEFLTTNKSWLNCVIGYRDDRYKRFSKEWDDFDVLIGKIADDNTSNVLNTYLMGNYGKIGSEKAVDFAISLLLPERLNNQICFRTLKSIKRLKFMRCEQIWV